VDKERSRETDTRLRAPLLLRWWHLASLDAPTVAVVWSLSFARSAGVHFPSWVPLLVGLGTWCAYVGDRILDAGSALKTGKLESLRERHFFHWRHRRVLLPVAACAALASAAIVLAQMPTVIRARDSVLALAALAYFSIVHVPRLRPRWFKLHSKEVLVGTLFTAGCALPTLTRLGDILPSVASVIFLFLAIGLYAALAWLNCWAIDRWEAGVVSRSTTLPARFIGAGAAVLALPAALFVPRLSILLAACAASALLLGLLDLQRGRLTPLTLRCAADLVLLAPIICLVQ
jgi:hypothetical protein